YSLIRRWKSSHIILAEGVATSGTTITITGDAPWVTVTGTLNANGNFAATGAGTVAGYPNVPVTFIGNVTANGVLTGTLQLGQNAAPTGLPGGAVTYTVGPRN
ncbi:MAG: hypothetical protein ABJB74_04565, partial [Gemmatimonas sp.]